MNVIYWAGDSIVQTNNYTTYPQTGIGQVFPMFLREGCRLENYAKNGRSTKNFMADGRLATIEAKIQKGDFLFIQFGHNDAHTEDPNRYTAPFGDYKSNLKEYIRVARDQGAYPVLITPLERRNFVDEWRLEPSAHGDYLVAMKQVAEECSVPLVDLCEMSRQAMEEAGEVKSRRWHMIFEAGEYPEHPAASSDNTHLRYEGAVKYGSLIARGLIRLGGVYQELILDEMLRQ